MWPFSLTTLQSDVSEHNQSAYLHYRLACLKVNGFFEWVSGLKPGIRSVVTTGLQYLQVLLYIIKYEIKYLTVEL